MLRLLGKAAPYLLGVFALCVLYWNAYQNGYDTAGREWADQVREATRAAERIQRDEEQRRQAAINEVTQHAREQIERAQADAATAAATAGRLREQAERLAERAGRACSNTAPAAGGEAGRAAGMVLADLLARADARAGELAAAYDRARAAGLACERAYQRVRGEQ